MSEKGRICVIGDRSLIIGFRSLGLEAFEAQTPEELVKALANLGKDDIALVTENLLTDLDPGVYRDRWIVPIPERERTGFGASRIKRMVERAIGMELR